MDLFSVRNRRVLVTGATRGIGFALADGFAAAGAEVMLTARGEAGLEDALQTLRERYPEAILHRMTMDVSDTNEVRRAMLEAVAIMGGIDTLINNAGQNIRKKAMDVLEQDWDAVVDTNLRGAFFVAQAAGRVMIEQGGGSIVNIASVGGQVALRTGVAYAAAKAGLLHMTRVLAVEWATRNVRVNAIGPWYFRTPLTEKLLDDRDYLAEILACTPMKRVGDVRELVGPALFLASDAASYVTGQTLMVDGGMSVYGF
ncbi:SDR family NAD(P)-dependent oxidoreductase [Ferroacidibacillus organovorans]|uniref:2-deoxy-D-gluconate 3-dehydrogenase n=1 Tax=Ferroacidibacillus organovorans TaxID=1765683 RepID=A0A162TJZ3_9BACL|nr:SDR family oxidoreductase [Ferroacidibacillus organovorans]KYP80882.1 2-deoxy-D-gluconate 3-dehydrogenase [Ferroacidibacillus organovorans]OAG95427.1 2-deoxy-D-gluconate 3-dehydrogenase [Ferroacidibacillus organovorans]OPG17568.1 2-deoxy-D-gluconate 3-dehydrogenase [Ferroacidibacillus organovorans]